MNYRTRFVLWIFGLLIGGLMSCGEPNVKDESSSGKTPSTPSVPTPTNTNLNLPKRCGELGKTVFGGILIQEDGGKCVVMETTDRAECRLTDNFTKCKSWSQASALCEAGITAGESWYLPNHTELTWVWAQRGSGNAVSSNGLCVGDAGICMADTAANPPRYPYYYWASPLVSAGLYQALVNGAVDAQGRPENQRYSVRCIKRVPPDPAK